MKTLKLHEVKAQLSELIEQVSSGEEIIIPRHVKPVAKLTGLGSPQKRSLGFYPIYFESNLLEPTDDEVIATFYGN